MLKRFTICPNTWYSLFIMAANSCGVPTLLSVASESRNSTNLGSRKTRTTSVFKRVTMASGAMLPASLQAVISQTLCKTKDGSGRVAAHEIMIGTPAIRNLIRENKIAQMYSSIQTGNSVGMQTLDQNLTDLVRRNVISPAEARAKAKMPENFPG